MCFVGLWSWGSFCLTTNPPLETIYITLKAFVRWGHPRESPCMTCVVRLISHVHICIGRTRQLLERICASHPRHSNSLSVILLQGPILTMILAYCKAVYHCLDHQVECPCYVSHTLSQVAFISFSFPISIFFSPPVSCLITTSPARPESTFPPLRSVMIPDASLCERQRRLQF